MTDEERMTELRTLLDDHAAGVTLTAEQVNLLKDPETHRVVNINLEYFMERLSIQRIPEGDDEPDDE